MSLGPYASFIVTSYALVAAVVLVLIIWIAIDYRRQKARLRELEAAGVIRRSGRSAAEVKMSEPGATDATPQQPALADGAAAARLSRAAPRSVPAAAARRRSLAEFPRP